LHQTKSKEEEEEDDDPGVDSDAGAILIHAGAVGTTSVCGTMTIGASTCRLKSLAKRRVV
jgi:hypothetical protein